MFPGGGCPAPVRGLPPAVSGPIAITYINCSADVKALSDIICTRATLKNHPPDTGEQGIIFAPTATSGYLVRKTGREMVAGRGPASSTKPSAKKTDRPAAQPSAAKLIAHPECEAVVLDQADFIGSTSALLRHVQQSPNGSSSSPPRPGSSTRWKNRVRENIHSGASRGKLRVQSLSLYENVHARETVPVHEKPFARNLSRRCIDREGADTNQANARNELTAHTR